MKWEKKILSEIANNIQTGPFGSQLHQSDYSETGIPVVMPKNLLNGSILENDIARVDETHVERLSRHIIQNGDILYSRRGDVGKCAYTTHKEEGWLCGTGCLRVSINEKIANSKFVFYQLQKKETIGWVEKHAVGSTMLNLNTSILGMVPIETPDLETQEKIVSILSAYDNLIENNQKQIKLLEEAAQRLYKEWFVDLRFPGHENVKIVDGVPEGWSKVQLQELIDFDIGGGWGEEAQSATSEIPAYVIRGTDFEDIINGNFTLLPFRYHKKSNYESRKLQGGDIVFEVSGGSKNEGVARTLLVSKELLSSLNDSVICASFCKLVRPKKGFSQYLFDTFKFMRYAHITEQYDKRSASSIVNYRWQDFIAQELISVPDTVTLSKYTSLLENISQAIMSRVRVITLAKEARDRLLPKLMSGEIEV